MSKKKGRYISVLFTRALVLFRKGELLAGIVDIAAALLYLAREKFARRHNESIAITAQLQSKALHGFKKLLRATKGDDTLFSHTRIL